jgi:hypothetical protein
LRQGRHTPFSLFAAFGLYAAAFVASLLAVSVTLYGDLSPRPLVELYAERSEAEVLRRLIATRVVIFDKNLRKQNQKALWWWVSVVALAFGLAISAVAIVIGK